MPHQRAKEMIDSACTALSQVAAEWRASDIYPSSSGYENLVAELSCELPYADLLHLTKHTETRLGRTPEMKESGLVPIDIDIVYYDGEVMRPQDAASAYFRQGLRALRPESEKKEVSPRF